MDVGQLNKVIVFKKNTPTVLGAGKKDSYATLLTTRGSFKQLSANKTLAYGEISQGNGWECITRFDTTLEANLRMDLKVEYNGNTYTIQSWEKMGEKRFYYKFILSGERN